MMMGIVGGERGAAAGAYAGPGDIASGWEAWYGMRAFSAASAATGTQKAVRLKYPDTTSVDYFTQADGTINLTVGSNGQSHTFNAALFGGTAVVTIWYDQSGNGRDLDLTVAAGNSPAFTTSALGSSPGITFSGIESGTSGGSGITLSAPLSYSMVAKVTGAGAFYNFATSNGNGQCAHDGSQVWYCYANGAGSENVTAANNAFHAAQFSLNGTSSHTYVDGVDQSSGANIGAAAFSGSPLYIAATSSGTGKLVGVMMEIGLNNGSLASVQSALNSNQHGTSGYNF